MSVSVRHVTGNPSSSLPPQLFGSKIRIARPVGALASGGLEGRGG